MMDQKTAARKDLADNLEFLASIERVLASLPSALTAMGASSPRSLALRVEACRNAIVWNARLALCEGDVKDLLSEAQMRRYCLLASALSREAGAERTFLEDAGMCWRQILEGWAAARQDLGTWKQLMALTDRRAAIQKALGLGPGTEASPFAAPFNPLNLVWEDPSKDVPRLGDLKEVFMDDLFDELTKIRCGVSGQLPMELASEYCLHLLETYAQASGRLPESVLRDITGQVDEVVTWVLGPVDYGSWGDLYHLVLRMVYRD